MTKWLWLAGVAMVACASTPAVACVEVVGPAMASVGGFDPLGQTAVSRSFTLQFRQQSDSPAEVSFIQFVDNSDAGSRLKIGGGPEGYAIFQPQNAHDNLVSGVGAFSPPPTSGSTSGWARVVFDETGRAQEQFTVQFDGGYAPAGVYDEALDIRVACGRAGAFSPQLLSGAVQIQVAVNNMLQIGGARQPVLDFEELRTSGDAARKSMDLDIRASGPFVVSFRSDQASRWADGRTPMLKRVDDLAAASDANSIPYALSVDGTPVRDLRSELRCGGRLAPLDLQFETEPAPGAQRLEGDYADVLEITLTPNFDGPATESDSCRVTSN